MIKMRNNPHNFITTMNSLLNSNLLKTDFFSMKNRASSIIEMKNCCICSFEAILSGKLQPDDLDAQISRHLKTMTTIIDIQKVETHQMLKPFFINKQDLSEREYAEAILRIKKERIFVKIQKVILEMKGLILKFKEEPDEGTRKKYEDLFYKKRQELDALERLLDEFIIAETPPEVKVTAFIKAKKKGTEKTSAFDDINDLAHELFLPLKEKVRSLQIGDKDNSIIISCEIVEYRENIHQFFITIKEFINKVEEFTEYFPRFTLSPDDKRFNFIINTDTELDEEKIIVSIVKFMQLDPYYYEVLPYFASNPSFINDIGFLNEVLKNNIKVDFEFEYHISSHSKSFSNYVHDEIHRSSKVLSPSNQIRSTIFPTGNWEITEIPPTATNWIKSNKGNVILARHARSWLIADAFVPNRVSRFFEDFNLKNGYQLDITPKNSLTQSLVLDEENFSMLDFSTTNKELVIQAIYTNINDSGSFSVHIQDKKHDILIDNHNIQSTIELFGLIADHLLLYGELNVKEMKSNKPHEIMSKLNGKKVFGKEMQIDTHKYIHGYHTVKIEKIDKEDVGKFKSEVFDLIWKELFIMNKPRYRVDFAPMISENIYIDETIEYAENGLLTLRLQFTELPPYF